jgi:hypothetical protein
MRKGRFIWTDTWMECGSRWQIVNAQGHRRSADVMTMWRTTPTGRHDAWLAVRQPAVTQARPRCASHRKPQWRATG